MNIIEAAKDEMIFRPFLEEPQKGIHLRSWSRWLTVLRIMYGLPIHPKKRELVQRCTGRDVDNLPKDGFDESLLLVGRRSGKSKISALVALYEAALSERWKHLSRGEIGLVACVAPTKKQGGIVRSYIEGAFDASPLLKQEIVKFDKENIVLRNGVHITVLIGDWRHIRGFTLLALIVEEAAFFQLSEECKVRSDTELIRAVRPSLATVGGRLVSISSPYAKKGYCYDVHKRCFGNDGADILCWNTDSRTMNSTTLKQSTIDRAYAEDPASARAEYGGLFREDIETYVSRELVESLVVRDRKELMPDDRRQYTAFVDVSGGRKDAASLCIGHRHEGKITVDYLRQWKAPHDPYVVIEQMAGTVRKYGLTKCTADNYAGEFVVKAFASHGIVCTKSDLPKSQLYIELLPQLCSAKVELVDDTVLIDQLAALERRTRSGGRDSVDHPAGGHDDAANTLAGMVYHCGKGGGSGFKIVAFG